MNMCSVVLQKMTLQLPQQQIETYPLSSSGEYSILISSEIETIAAQWQEAAPQDNIFLQHSYLAALEQFPPEKMRFGYGIVYQRQKPIGVIYVQRFHLNLEESNQKEEETASVCVLKAIGRALKKWVMRRADYNIIIGGNLLLTGDHGFYFAPEVGTEKALELAQCGVQLFQQLWEQTGEKIHIQLFKDFAQPTTHPAVLEQLPKYGYHKFQMQPAMQMDIHWKTFDEYLAAMSSKYRVRARRAFKKAAPIQKRALSLEEIQALQPRIYELYKLIADGAGFNAFLLHPHYFTALKQYLGDRFEIVGYFFEDQLVAFRTTILNGKELEAHFLGVDDHYNRAYQVYLNILYDLVGAGIYHQVQHIDFARTALEIKSSVGAVAVEMDCFIRHRNKLSNALLTLLIRYLSPKEEWQPRHPFKEGEEE